MLKLNHTLRKRSIIVKMMSVLISSESWAFFAFSTNSQTISYVTLNLALSIYLLRIFCAVWENISYITCIADLFINRTLLSSTETLEMAGGDELEKRLSWAGRQVSWVLDIDVILQTWSPTSTSMSASLRAKSMFSPYRVVQRSTPQNHVQYNIQYKTYNAPYVTKMLFVGAEMTRD